MVLSVFMAPPISVDSTAAIDHETEPKPIVLERLNLKIIKANPEGNSAAETTAKIR